MLYLVGLGLGDAKDITVKGLEIVKKADYVFLEAYTSILCVGKEALVGVLQRGGEEKGVNKAVRVQRELIVGLSLQSNCDCKFNLFDNFITNSTSLFWIYSKSSPETSWKTIGKSLFVFISGGILWVQNRVSW